MVRKLAYLFYYFWETDRKKFQKFLQYAFDKTGRSKFSLVLEMLRDSVRFNISFLEYFQFGFYTKTNDEKNTFAGTGFMYEYQLKMNPKHSRDILEDKIKFLSAYSEFVNRGFATLDQLKTNPKRYSSLINKSDKVVIKGSRGQVGAEVDIIDALTLTNGEVLIAMMEKKGYDLAEEFVIQHTDLMTLSPSGLNTVRVITQVVADRVEIIGARLRITINSKVDNMAAGNPAAPIDIITGKIYGPAVFSDITKLPVDVHPVTNTPIVGFQIPHWNEIIELVKRAALKHPQNRSIGWDVAVGEITPQLIEGNHNWCKLLWQLPVHHGLKENLLKYI